MNESAAFARDLAGKVKQHGGIACHTGNRTCFYRKIER